MKKSEVLQFRVTPKLKEMFIMVHERQMLKNNISRSYSETFGIMFSEWLRSLYEEKKESYENKKKALSGLDSEKAEYKALIEELDNNIDQLHSEIGFMEEFLTSI